MANILLISYDNESHVPFFPQNLFYLMGALKSAGHRVMFYPQDILHSADSHITQVLDHSGIDIVCLGFVAGYYQYRKAKSISKAVNMSKRRNKFKYVLGGHGPAAAPGYFIETMMADTVLPLHTHVSSHELKLFS